MKKILSILMLFSAFIINAQSKNDTLDSYQKKNEFKLNVLAPISGSVEIGYERLLNKKSSIGISAFYVYDNTSGNDDSNYSISSYYRRYFGKKYASGFFVEGFGMLTSIDGKKIYDPADHSKFTENPDVTDFALGAGLGWKWATKSGFIFEANVGAAGLLFNANKTDHTIVAKFGLGAGYRF